MPVSITAIVMPEPSTPGECCVRGIGGCGWGGVVTVRQLRTRRTRPVLLFLTRLVVQTLLDVPGLSGWGSRYVTSKPLRASALRVVTFDVSIR